jgi:plasmid stabilization system protein ParE
MELRWTEEAAADLEHIADYLFENAPRRAAELVREIYKAPSKLVKFPNRGRPGKKRGDANSCLHRCHILWSTKSPGISFMFRAFSTVRKSGLKARQRSLLFFRRLDIPELSRHSPLAPRLAARRSELPDPIPDGKWAERWGTL